MDIFTCQPKLNNLLQTCFYLSMKTDRCQLSCFQISYTRY